MLREPVIRFLKTNFNREFIPEDETQPGELYIDSLGVKPDHQGMGVGTKLLQYIIDQYVHTDHRTIGLLVEKENIKAKHLYIKLGFEIVGQKILAGKNMDHLQFKIHD